MMEGQFTQEKLQKSIDYWLSGAESDAGTSKVLFDNQRYAWSLFIAHLVLEKSLKALWVKVNQDIVVPRICNQIFWNYRKMAKENTATIEKIVKEFVRRVQKKFRVDAAYWFGSTAYGKGDEYSDIDIAVVSPDFTGVRFDDRHNLAPIIVNPDSRIEVHPFSTEDFNDEPMMAVEILRTGKRIVLL